MKSLSYITVEKGKTEVSTESISDTMLLERKTISSSPVRQGYQYMYHAYSDLQRKDQEDHGLISVPEIRTDKEKCTI